MKLLYDELLFISTELFRAYGLSVKDANIASNCLVEAELAGITTHGFSMLPEHIKKLRNGYNAEGVLEIERNTPAITTCNAHNSVGMISAYKCAELAIEGASQIGIHMVFCHNANTFSAAYCYAKQIVDAGKIGIICSNSPAQMAPINGKDKLLGTNPLAIGIPAALERPFILDMATSAVAKSKINQAMHRGETIPIGWATDSDGIPTNDPKKAVLGLILPMAGAKGYGLSMAIDILAGLLSHASYLDDVGRFYSPENKCMNVGYLVIAIDPVIIFGEKFYEEMDEYLKRVRNSNTVVGENIYIPGERSLKSSEEAHRFGVEISDGTISVIRELFKEKGLVLPKCLRGIACE